MLREHKIIVFCAIALYSISIYALPANNSVRQHNIDATICVPGYTRTIRPPTLYTNKIKKQLMRQQGMPLADIHDYELDHIVPLDLGGCPRCVNNLQLQPWYGPDGAHKKDRLEVKLQCLVCTGQVPLSIAQRAIYTDWQAAYHHYARMKCHRNRRMRETNERKRR